MFEELEVSWYGAYFHNADTGYISGDRWNVGFTEDGGSNWENHYVILDHGRIMEDIVFVNDTVGISVGGPTAIFKTVDGENWELIDEGMENGLFQAVDFPSQLTGYIVGSIILKTVNQGNNWNELNAGVNARLEDVSFVNTTIGYAVGRDETIIKTVDGGQNWIQLDAGLDGFECNFYSVQFLTPNTGFVGGENGTIIKTVDGGDTWERLETNYNSSYDTNPPGLAPPVFNGLHFTNADYGYAVAGNLVNYQRVVRTTNGGEFWGIQNSNALGTYSDPAGLDDVHFGEFNVGYAVGYHGTIIKYAFPMPEGINEQEADMQVEEVYAQLGDLVTLPVTVDLPEDFSISSFEVDLSGYQGFVEFQGVNTDNTLVEEKDWLFEYNPDESLLMVSAAGADEISGSGTLFNLRFYVTYVTSLDFIPVKIVNAFFDNGNTEINTTNGGINLKDPMYGDASGDSTVNAYDASVILKYLSDYIPHTEIDSTSADVSLDNSLSTLDASLILQYTVSLIDSLPYSGTGFNANGTLALEDAKVSPSDQFVKVPVKIQEGENIYGFHAEIDYDNSKLEYVDVVDWDENFSSFTKVIKNENGKIKISAASTENIAADGNFVNVKFKLLNLTEGQTEVKLSELRWNENETQTNVSSSLVSVVTDVDNSEAIPEEYSLKQNYPNPFNPSTKIFFGLPNADNVKIVVYNFLGEKIQEVVDRQYAAGKYTVTFDGSNLTSGIYYYKIRAGNFTQTRKMMLVK